MLCFKQGNITEDDADILVNTVNCVGVMGKGVALAFAQKWPEIVPVYQQACYTKQLIPGGCLLFNLPLRTESPRYWAALATKDQYYLKSRYEWIQSGLQHLAQLAIHHQIKSIAIPPPGCGNGGLNWLDIYPLVTSLLWWIDLRIYAQSPYHSVIGEHPS